MVLLEGRVFFLQSAEAGKVVNGALDVGRD